MTLFSFYAGVAWVRGWKSGRRKEPMLSYYVITFCFNIYSSSSSAVCTRRKEKLFNFKIILCFRFRFTAVERILEIFYFDNFMRQHLLCEFNLILNLPFIGRIYLIFEMGNLHCHQRIWFSVDCVKTGNWKLIYKMEKSSVIFKTTRIWSFKLWNSNRWVKLFVGKTRK